MIAGLRVRDYRQLTAAIAARRRQLGLRQLQVDELAGVQSGYTGKLECGDRHFGPLSLPMLLAALNCDLYLAPRQSAPAPAERRTRVDPTLGRSLASPQEGPPSP